MSIPEVFQLVCIGMQALQEVWLRDDILLGEGHKQGDQHLLFPLLQRIHDLVDAHLHQLWPRPCKQGHIRLVRHLNTLLT